MLKDATIKNVVGVFENFYARYISHMEHNQESEAMIYLEMANSIEVLSHQNDFFEEIRKKKTILENLSGFKPNTFFVKQDMVIN